MTTATESKIERAVGRDVRVDYVGFCNELTKQFVEPSKSAIKESMSSRQLDLAEADFFEGLLVTTSTSVVDPEKFLRLFLARKITRAQFLSAISISRSAAKEFMAPKDLDSISDPQPVSTSLRITRKKDVPFQLVDALTGLGEAIKKKAS